MPWESKVVENEREKFIADVLSGEESKRAICRKYGISRVTGDKWLERYKAGESMDDRSRAPFHTPRKMPPSICRRKRGVGMGLYHSNAFSEMNAGIMFGL